jgi:hypothetical protein
MGDRRPSMYMQSDLNIFVSKHVKLHLASAGRPMDVDQTM